MSFWMAWKMIWENKKRTAFSLIGVLMGISSIIMIFSLAEGGKKVIKNDLSALAENRIIIGGENISLQDVKTVEAIPFVRYIYLPEARTDIDGLILTGYSQKTLLKMGYHLKDREIILENGTAEKILGSIREAGREMKIGRERFMIKGEYEDKNPINSGERGIVTLSTLEMITGKRKFSKMMVAFPEGEEADNLAPVVIDRLKKAHRNRGNYIVLENSGRYKQMEKIKKTLNIFLASIGTVALVMGGLGISNFMAAMVRERTPHIGILRAMGAGKDFIMETFLIEATVISLAGGLVGIGTGIGGSVAVGRWIEIPPIFMGKHIAMTLVVSALLGIAFGILPAKRAAEMESIEALRE